MESGDSGTLALRVQCEEAFARWGRICACGSASVEEQVTEEEASPQEVEKLLAGLLQDW